MRRTRATYSIIALIVGIGVVTLVLFVATRTPPWVPQGRVVVAVYAVPSTPDVPQTIGLGIDDIELTRSEGDAVSATVLSRRITIDASDQRIRVLTDTALPSGSYSGVRFRITSPETRNTADESEAARPIVLGGETLMLDIPYEVQEGETNVILLGFETRNTIHEDGGSSVYLPVIHTEVRSGSTVLPGEDDVVRVAEGAVLGSALFGMDWNGAMRFNYRPPILRPSEQALTEHEPVGEPVAGVEAETQVTSSTTTENESSDSVESTSTSTPPDGEAPISENEEAEDL